MKNTASRIGISVCIVAVLYGVWRYDMLASEISLIWANTQRDMTLYTGKDHAIERYNQALYEAKQGEYLAAENLLKPLLNDNSLSFRADMLELYGDIEYMLEKPQEVIEIYYKKSLEITPDNLRVEKKLELLKERSLVSTGSTASGSTVSGEIKTPETLSGSTEKQQKLEELNKLSRERGNYMDYTSSPTLTREALLQDSLDILNGGKEKQNW